MAAKIDKDALKKNGFWVGLGAFLLLWLVGLIVVMATNQRKKKEEEFQAAKKKIDGEIARGIKSEESDLDKNPFTKDWLKYGRTFMSHKDVIWQQAWAAQRDMYTWPENIVPPHPKDKKMTAKPPLEGEGANDDEKTRREAHDKSRRGEDAAMREKYRTEGYIAQFGGLEGSVFPVKFNGGFTAVFPPQEWDRTRRPTIEEVILAQEDFWVRREMLDIVRATQDSVREMKEVTEDPRLPRRNPNDKSPVARRIFRNAYWELDLVFAPGDKGTRWVVTGDSRLKNITTTGKTLPLVDLSNNLGLPFRVSQADDPLNARTWRISGEPLAPGADRQLKPESFVTIDLKKPIRIHQYLFYEISPVRRIDLLALGLHSHRTSTAGLKLNEELKKLEPVVEGEAAAGGEGTTTSAGGPGAGGTGSADAGSGARGGMGMMGMMGPGEGPGGMGGMAAGEATSVNGIPRKRYMHVTPQTRHLPIALRLIVDQAHVNDVLTAVSNSRMRIQVTQVQMHHVRDADHSGAGMGLPGMAGPGGRPGAPGYPGMAGPGGPGTGGRIGMPGAGVGRPGMPGTGSGDGGPGAGRPGGAGAGRPGLPGAGRGGPPAGYMGGVGTGGLRNLGGRITGPQGLRDFMPSRPGGPGEGDVGTGDTTTTQFKDTARLVELSIYGVASLYEPFKPGMSAAAAPATTEEKKP